MTNKTTYLFILFSLAFSFYIPFSHAAQLLVTTVNCTNVSADWSAMPEAESYTLYYAYADYNGDIDMSTLGSIDMGQRKNIFVEKLPSGLIIYTAVMAHTSQGDILSNIEKFMTFGGTLTNPETDAHPCESVDFKRLIDFIIENLPNMTRPETMPDLSNLIPDIIPTLPPTTPSNILRDINASLQGEIKNDTFGDDVIIGGKESLLLAHNDFTLALEALTAPPNIHGMVANMLRGFENLYMAAEMKEIDPADAEEIIVRSTQLAREVSSQAIDAAIAQEENSDIIKKAQDALDKGDRLLRGGKYAQAGEAYLGVVQNAFSIFSIAAFESNIQNAMTGNALGYAYTINMNGYLTKFGSDGLARTAYDSPLSPHSVSRPQEVASVSKPFTAVAVHQLLDEQNISVDDSIAPYLPSSWNTDSITLPDHPKLTFRQLFTHTSGLNGSSDAEPYYDALKSYIEAGTGAKNYTYENGNYGMFRVLIAGLMGIDIKWLAVYMNMTEEMMAASVYEWYMTDNVLAPIFITEATLLPRGPYPTLLNGFPATESGNLGGLNWDGNYFLSSGAFGRYFSALELSRFLSILRYSSVLLSPDVRQQMDDELLGWRSTNGKYGAYINHGGDWTMNKGGQADSHEAHACIMNFPNNVEAAVVISSDRNFSQCAVLRDGYDGAWIWGLY